MRLAAGFAPVLMLAGAVAFAQPGSGRERDGRPGGPFYANPSAVIAADLGLGRAARDKGQWRALRDAAGAGSVLFAPRAVDAESWLKRQAEPATPASWLPQRVWISCDGGHAVSRGVWTRGGESGPYLAVWERQKNGKWKWLVRDNAPAGDVGKAPEMIAAKVAECSGLPRRRPEERPAKRAADARALRDAANAASHDRSLRWSFRIGSRCELTMVVEIWNGTALDRAIEAHREAPPGDCG